MPFKRISVVAGLSLFLAAPVLAEGDSAAGETVFGKCKSCHAIVADDETVIQKGGKIGPNLFAIIGRTAGTYPEFKYGDDMIAAGAAGLVWDDVSFLAYVQDPKAFLQDFLQNDSAKTKMTFKLTKGGEDLLAYLAGLSGADGVADEDPEATETE